MWNCTGGGQPVKPFEIGYEQIQPLLRTSPTGVRYDHVTASAYFDYQCDMNTPKLSPPCHPGRNQVWFDTPATLALKYSMLRAAGVRGVGMWDAGSVGYTEADDQAAEMWDMLQVFAEVPLNTTLDVSSNSSSSHVKWLGSMDFYEPAYKGAINVMVADSSYKDAVQSKTLRGLPTFWGDSCFPGAMNCSGVGGPVQGPHGCLKNGGCWHLQPDGVWQAAVDAEAAKLQPLIDNGTVVGIFLGDEMVCNGLAFIDFVKLVKRVRAKIPGIPLWANECCGTITGAKAGGEWEFIPEELDYISYDCCAPPLQPPQPLVSENMQPVRG